jgi:hypothetical protein
MGGRAEYAAAAEWEEGNEGWKSVGCGVGGASLTERQWPLVGTGRAAGQEVHWRSRRGRRQEPQAEKVLEGQMTTHLPDEASWLEAQVRQNVGEPVQVVQEQSQAVQVKLSAAENVPVGRLSTHFPCERRKPGTHPVDWGSSTSDVPLKFGNMHDVHFALQPKKLHS